MEHYSLHPSVTRQPRNSRDSYWHSAGHLEFVPELDDLYEDYDSWHSCTSYITEGRQDSIASRLHGQIHRLAGSFTSPPPLAPPSPSLSAPKPLPHVLVPSLVEECLMEWEKRITEASVQEADKKEEPKAMTDTVEAPRLTEIKSRLPEMFEEPEDQIVKAGRASEDSSCSSWVVRPWAVRPWSPGLPKRPRKRFGKTMAHWKAIQQSLQRKRYT